MWGRREWRVGRTERDVLPAPCGKRPPRSCRGCGSAAERAASRGSPPRRRRQRQRGLAPGVAGRREAALGERRARRAPSACRPASRQRSPGRRGRSSGGGRVVARVAGRRRLAADVVAGGGASCGVGRRRLGDDGLVGDAGVGGGVRRARRGRRGRRRRPGWRRRRSPRRCSALPGRTPRGRGRRAPRGSRPGSPAVLARCRARCSRARSCSWSDVRVLARVDVPVGAVVLRKTFDQPGAPRPTAPAAGVARTPASSRVDEGAACAPRMERRPLRPRDGRRVAVRPARAAAGCRRPSRSRAAGAARRVRRLPRSTRASPAGADAARPTSSGCSSALAAIAVGGAARLALRRRAATCARSPRGLVGRRAARGASRRGRRVTIPWSVAPDRSWVELNRVDRLRR